MNLHHTTIVNPFLQSQYLRPAWQDPVIDIEDPRVVQRLVNNLMYLFNLVPGDYLTFVLGQGRCHDNQEALKYWVLEQLTDEPISQEDLLNHLVQTLKHQLTVEVYS